jgi:hypothetical protein
VRADIAPPRSEPHAGGSAPSNAVPCDSHGVEVPGTVPPGRRGLPYRRSSRAPLGLLPIAPVRRQALGMTDSRFSTGTELRKAPLRLGRDRRAGLMPDGPRVGARARFGATRTVWSAPDATSARTEVPLPRRSPPQGRGGAPDLITGCATSLARAAARTAVPLLVPRTVPESHWHRAKPRPGRIRSRECRRRAGC